MLSIRKIGVIGRTYRHLNRYRQILTVLFRYGFEDVIERLRIDQYIEVGLQVISKKRRHRVEKLTRAERVRMAFEELGPTYIKLGQVLSTRPDLVPVEFIEELAKLQDEVPPCLFEEVVHILESELGQPPEKLFESFEHQPIASASIGQVHKAALPDGEDIAVKIQRPGIQKTIEVDLEIMLHLATLSERHIEELAIQRPVRIVEEFARTLEREIDYKIEATNMERFARNFLDDPKVYIPKVYRDMTTERVLTMEFVEGIKVSETEEIHKAGLDPKQITSRGAVYFLKQVFDYGFFHADPHPGNIFVLPNNTICLLDYGMVGAVDKYTREDFVELVDGIVRQDESRATQMLLKLTSWDDDPDTRQLEREVGDFMGMHLYKPLKEIEIGKLLQQMLDLASRHRLMIPPDLFLMMKALGQIEGVGLQLDPEFDMVAHTAPFIERIKLARFTPQRISDDLYRIATELFQFVQKFPRDMLDISRQIRQQKLSLKFENQSLETMLGTYDQISNRISFSIVIAALIIGSALIVISETPPLFYDISLIGIIGFLAAALMGVWLLVAIIRKGRL